VEEKPSGFWADVVVRVDPEQCRRCLDCAPMAACTANAFRRERPDSVPVTDENFCFGCYACAAACPHDAIVLPRRR
jgi:Fe-S-cluster-containing dehydrogenase component